MYFYVALTWDAKDAAAVLEAQRLARSIDRSALGWEKLVDENGLAFFHKPHNRAFRAYKLPGGCGAIVGRLFPTHSFSPGWEPHFTQSSASAVVHSRGRALTDEYWGSYVALLRDPSSGMSRAVRDCSGRIPCYVTRHGGVTLVFSNIGDITDLGLPAFTINRRYLAAFIFSSQLQVPETGFNEVTELLAGNRLELTTPSLSQESLWDPREVCRAQSIENYGEARTRLHATTSYCVNAWASAFDNILLYLSGGLDSAIVLGCLRTANTQHPQVTCLNRFSPHAREDERHYARLAAEKHAARLIEEPFYAADRLFDTELFTSPRSAKPTIAGAISILDLDFRNKIASTLRADTVWTGEGGDHLFYQAPVSIGAADFYQRHGFGHRFLREVVNSARLARQPYVTVFRECLRLGRSRKSWQPPGVADRIANFVEPDALPANAIEYVSHAWTRGNNDLPKGKQHQIHFLAEVLNRHRPFPGAEFAYEHHPLLSQPLIELCMQIPVYHLLHGGRQRALAREAFRNEVPAAILEREEKGESTLSVVERFRRSEAFIRDLVLDGLLVREGLVNRKSLEPVVAHGQPLHVDNLFGLFACVAVEVWVHTLPKGAVQAAA